MQHNQPQNKIKTLEIKDQTTHDVDDKHNGDDDDDDNVSDAATHWSNDLMAGWLAGLANGSGRSLPQHYHHDQHHHHHQWFD